ncbi:acyltransferase [Arthrobacter sp. NamB2]|uniref:acyltransferase family protein n=1 Tax=Arthrobacter sp. NamB2 TaxID=2576035 RepID=UPI0010CA0EA4|nr:acyltransferase family protein [Arthrobacter sp. NamB2]TKV26930.1 acyltransferase [Arthrobacter sp. NamB2]
MSTREAAISATTSTRVGWLDSLRGVAILLVVVLHAGEALRIAVGPTPGMDQFNLFLEPFRMPGLMFLSGILLPRSLVKAAPEYIAGKASRVAWPYVLWSLIILAASGDLSPAAVAAIFYQSPTYLWYLWFILVFYGIAFPLRRIPPLAVSAAGLSASLLLPDGSRSGAMTFLAAFFFFGAWCAQHFRQLERMLDRPWVLLGAAASAVAVGVLSVVGQNVLYRAEYAWGVIGGLAIACWSFPRLGSNRVTIALEFIGRHSIVFYVAHLGPIMITLALVDAAGLAHDWFALPLLILVGAGTPLVLAWLYSTREHASINLLFELPTEMLTRKVRAWGVRRLRA